MKIIIYLVIGFVIFSILFHLWTEHTEQGKAYYKKFQEEEARKKAEKKRKKLDAKKPKKFSDLPSPKYANNPKPFLDIDHDYDNVFFMSYTSDSGRSSYRNFIIEDVYKKHGEWYLDAHDIDKDAPRTFRIDRINSLTDYDDEIFLDFNEILKRLKKG